VTRVARYLDRLYSGTMELVRGATLAEAEPRPGGHLVDLGCHEGAFTVTLAERVGAQPFGVEIIPEAANRARERGVEVVVGDLCQPLPFQDEAFDVVHSNQVIEHLPCTDHFFRETRRVLRSNGYALVCTNNLASWHNLVSLALGRQPTVCHVSDETSVGQLAGSWVNPNLSYVSHQRVFTARALEGLATHHGLTVERALGIGYYPLPPVLARPLAQFDRHHAAYVLLRLSR
jgi:ubiquinone/menaquinone biosynthesis C-methylase UbiE